jgi:hypothetical protein
MSKIVDPSKEETLEVVAILELAQISLKEGQPVRMVD